MTTIASAIERLSAQGCAFALACCSTPSLERSVRAHRQRLLTAGGQQQHLVQDLVAGVESHWGLTTAPVWSAPRRSAFRFAKFIFHYKKYENAALQKSFSIREIEFHIEG